MELVRGASLTGYFEAAQQLRLDVVQLLRNAGLSRSMMNDPDLMLPARSVVRLLEESAEAAACPTFGLLMAEQRQLSDLGAISVLIAHQPTLRAALDVMVEYRNRINSPDAADAQGHGHLVRALLVQSADDLRQANDWPRAFCTGLQKSDAGQLAPSVRLLQLRASGTGRSKGVRATVRLLNAIRVRFRRCRRRLA
jgi:hypothetical protein